MEHIGACLVRGLRGDTRRVIKLCCILYWVRKWSLIFGHEVQIFLLSKSGQIRNPRSDCPNRLSFCQSKPKIYRTFVRWLAVTCKLEVAHQDSEFSKCLNSCKDLSHLKHLCMCIEECRLVSPPMWQALQLAQENLFTTYVQSQSGIESFTLNKFLLLKVLETSLMSVGLQNRLTSLLTYAVLYPRTAQCKES